MRTIIAGSRGITDPADLERALASCPWQITTVLSGCAQGVDLLGEQWAAERSLTVWPFPADWLTHGPHEAGRVRNVQMAQQAQALVAVWDGSSPGTAHMIETATAYGLHVHVHRPAPRPPLGLMPVAPPALPSYRAGARLPAGMGMATVLPDLDFETYSEAGFVWDDEAGKWRQPPGASGSSKGLSVVGAGNYTAHPTCEILTLSYDLKDGRGRRRWRTGQPLPTDLAEHVRSGGLLEAWNVNFERWVWENVGVARLGWPPVAPWQWRCAMAKARASGYPGSLKNAGEVMRLATRKDANGDRLIKKFSMPRNPTKGDPRRRILPLWNEGDARGLALPAAAQSPAKHRAALALHLEDVADAQALADYNETDIVVEAEASIITPDLEGPELAWWQTHEAINHRGVHVDLEGVANCIAIIEQAYARYNAELHALTGIDAASKVQQLVGWLAAMGVSLPGLDEEQVEAALARTDLLPAARRVLEIRAAVGSASVKKLYAMRNRATPASRLVDLYIYHAARTGRSTGEGPQPTNMPKGHLQLARCGHYEKGQLVPGSGCGHHRTPRLMSCPWCGQLAAPQDATVTHEWNPEAAEDVLELAKRRSLDLMEHVFGDAFGAIVGSLRGLFDAAPGHDLISSDYNSIEAVGLAMISGEQWRIEVFRTHGKIYETSASMMYRVPFTEFERVKKETGQHHPLRQKGKVGELAFGYQGWLGAAQAFGMPGTEDEIKNDILAWRRASPAVEWLWGGATAGKAFGIVQNALLPDYTGQVGDEHRAVVGRVGRDGKWDRSPYFFGVEGMALLAVKMPGTRCPVLRLDGTPSGIEFEVRGDALYCLLPSNRWLTYHRPRIQPGERGESLSYEGWNSNPKNGPTGWIRMNTWGGRLVENIVQGTCRDILAPACIRLEAAGYPVVLHVYDEIVSEVPEGFGSNEEFERIMTERPEWAHDWPVKAPGGWRAKRYRKG